MVPDAEYFLPVSDKYRETAHTWPGAFTAALPMGAVILLFFYWVAPELAYLMPTPHREALLRAFKAPVFSVRNAVWAVCGIVIGAETHVFWDSFTHTDGWMVDRFPLLSTPLWGNHLHVDFVLQILSSVAGVGVVLYVYDCWARSEGFRLWTVREISWRSLLWAGLVAGCLLPALIESRTVQAMESFAFLETRHFVVVLLVAFVRNFVLAVAAAALGVKLLRRRTRLDVAY